MRGKKKKKIKKNNTTKKPQSNTFHLELLRHDLCEPYTYTILAALFKQPDKPKKIPNDNLI